MARVKTKKQRASKTKTTKGPAVENREPSPRDELDELIDRALSSGDWERGATRSKQRSRGSRKPMSTPGQVARTSPKIISGSTPKTLSRRVIQSGMLGIKPEVQDCYDHYKEPCFPGSRAGPSPSAIRPT